MIPSSLPVIVATAALTLLAAAVLAWAYWRGFFRDLEAQSRVIFEPDDFRLERPWETAVQRLERETNYGEPVGPAPGEWGRGMTARPDDVNPDGATSVATGPSLRRGEVSAVAAVRGLEPDDLAIRLRADASSRTVVLVLFSIAIGWLLVGSIFGDIASLKLHWPDFLTREAWLSFGRVRTAHLHAVNYGWATAALIGTSVWLLHGSFTRS